MGEAALETEIGAWLAEAADAAEDAERRADETPDWVHDKQRRLEKIRAAKAALETEAQAEAAAKAAAPKRYRGGRKPKRPPGQPNPAAQYNFTDPERRIMKGKDGFVQGYNAQAAVDAGGQIVVACTLTNNAADQAELGPLLDAIAAGLGLGRRRLLLGGQPRDARPHTRGRHQPPTATCSAPAGTSEAA